MRRGLTSLLGWLPEWLEAFSWGLVRQVADAIRYQPSQLDLSLAFQASHPGTPAAVARLVAAEHSRPATDRAGGIPYRLLRRAADGAERLFGPTGSAVVRSLSAAFVGSLDRAGAQALSRRTPTGARPNILVPHEHAVVVLAVDMRGFSNLTNALDDSGYLAELVGEYLSALTRIVERDAGVVHQYTGDGLLAIFLPEMGGTDAAATLERVAHQTARDLHHAFDELHARWRRAWRTAGRPMSPIGLGVGVSYGPATIGLLGPAGKKQFGVVGEPINLAAFLCSQAAAGTSLVDRGAFVRAGAPLADHDRVRLRSKKRHQRVDAYRLQHGRSGGRTRARRVLQR